MEPIQQFNEVKGKYPKFVPSEIPPAGLANLKTLEMQQVSFHPTVWKLRKSPSTHSVEKYYKMRSRSKISVKSTLYYLFCSKTLI